jgi:hypothetical protein
MRASWLMLRSAAWPGFAIAIGEKDSQYRCQT